jgi:hypothetical protein
MDFGSVAGRYPRFLAALFFDCPSDEVGRAGDEVSCKQAYNAASI